MNRSAAVVLETFLATDVHGKQFAPKVGKGSSNDDQGASSCDWRKAVQQAENLENLTVDRVRRVMALVYEHAGFREQIPASCNPLPCPTR